MSGYMSHELTAFARAFFHGAVLLCIYDSLTVWKTVRRSGRIASDLRDLLFWIFASLYTFRCFYQVSSGSLRGYLFVGLILGGLAWKYSLQPYYRYLGVKLLKMFGSILRIPVNILKKLRKRLKFRVEKGKIKVNSVLRLKAGEQKAGRRAQAEKRKGSGAVRKQFREGKRG